ncbi:MAG: IS91 family transposase [Thermodesulfovibrionales bacterium]|nr:IS91 family transposase [Thermodesulfovibrionales bacterium]
MPGVADIFRSCGPEYRDRYGHAMPPSHRRTMQDVVDCRTERMGGHLFRCSHCDHLRYSYHSCKNRSCPACHESDRKSWLEKRKREQLPVPYYHAVFTVPKELHEIIRSHQKISYALLMEAAALSLMKLASDNRYVGGKIGMLSVLHTWTRALVYHPHVHCLIPAGGLSHDNRYWLEARKTYLVPVRALSDIFRATFIALARRKLPETVFPQSIWKTPWVVYCKPCGHSTEKTLSYLARYVHQTAITNSRILSVERGKVTFRYKDSRECRWKTMTLEASEFIRRFLQHVLPRGFHKVRYYGLLSPRNRNIFEQIRRELTNKTEIGDAEPLNVDSSAKIPESIRLCPLCHKGYLISIMPLPRRWRAPP